MFYRLDDNEKQYKIVPENLEDYLTPRALAYWYMDDGHKTPSSFTIATHNFSYKEHLLLKQIFLNKYNIDITIRNHQVK